MTDTVERFSNRVENYVKYRPDYPREIISHLKENCGLAKESVIADIGCGPGISSKMFLEKCEESLLGFFRIRALEPMACAFES